MAIGIGMVMVRGMEMGIGDRGWGHGDGDGEMRDTRGMVFNRSNVFAVKAFAGFMTNSLHSPLGMLVSELIAHGKLITVTFV